MRWIVLTASVFLLAACGPGKPGGDRWIEKVKLANGEVLTVEREERFGQGEAGTSGGPLTYASLAFEYKGVRYKWESGNVVPRLLEIDAQGRPVVGGSIAYNWAWRQRGSPCDRGVVQYFENGKWNQIPSWTIHVSNKLNLAANRKKGEAGVSVAEQPGQGKPYITYEYSKNRCEKVEPGNVH